MVAAKLTFQEVLDATGGRLLHGKLNGAKGVSTDTRTLAEGDMFIALRGPNFDGHNFIKEALNKGGGAVVSRRTPDCMMAFLRKDHFEVEAPDRLPAGMGRSRLAYRLRAGPSATWRSATTPIRAGDRRRGRRHHDG